MYSLSKRPVPVMSRLVKLGRPLFLHIFLFCIYISDFYASTSPQVLSSLAPKDCWEGIRKESGRNDPLLHTLADSTKVTPQHQSCLGLQLMVFRIHSHFLSAYLMAFCRSMGTGSISRFRASPFHGASCKLQSRPTGLWVHVAPPVVGPLTSRPCTLRYGGRR
jgi:hypothetical protein